jgi:hypothetical protein
MVARRELLAGSVLSGIFAGEQISDRAAADIITALKDLRTAIESQYVFSDIGQVRQRMVEFLKAQAKFPDFMEVGIDVWMAAYDWHVKHVQPITVGRDGGGRYTLTLMQTQLILRPDTVANFIGAPYDNR